MTEMIEEVIEELPIKGILIAAGITNILTMIIGTIVLITI